MNYPYFNSQSLSRGQWDQTRGVGGVVTSEMFQARITGLDSTLMSEFVPPRSIHSQSIPNLHRIFHKKNSLVEIESLDSLGRFVRDNELSNSANYPFFNNYDENSIGRHQAVVYRTILEGNKYNDSNRGIKSIIRNGDIRSETYEDILQRRMRAIGKETQVRRAVPLEKPLLKLEEEEVEEARFENDILGNKIQPNKESSQWIRSIVDPFNEDDLKLARINNKFFDNLAWYSKDIVKGENEFQSEVARQQQRRQNDSEKFIYYIHSSDRPGSIQLYKFDLDIGIFKSQKVEIGELHRFAWIQIQNRQEIFLCGGRIQNITQKGCMYLDFTLGKSILSNKLVVARYDHLLVQLGDNVYVIGGQGEHGQTLQTCEVFKIGMIQSQQKSEDSQSDVWKSKIIASLQLSRQGLTGCVSETQQCIYVTGVPLIQDDQIIIERYEPHTRFWGLLKIQVGTLGLKQPRRVRIACYDENENIHAYIFCQNLQKFEDYVLVLHDLTSQEREEDNEKNNKSESMKKKKKDIYISDKLTENSPRQAPLKYVRMFDDQVKLNYKNRKKYEEALRLARLRGNISSTELESIIFGERKNGQDKQDYIRGNLKTVKVQESTSSFQNSEVLFCRGSTLVLIDQDNPLGIEKLDFRDWQKQIIIVKYSQYI